MQNLNKFAETLETLNLSKEAAAVILGVSFLSVRSWANGQRRPSQEAEKIAILQARAKAFKKALEDLKNIH